MGVRRGRGRPDSGVALRAFPQGLRGERPGTAALPAAIPAALTAPRAPGGTHGGGFGMCPEGSMGSTRPSKKDTSAPRWPPEKDTMRDIVRQKLAGSSMGVSQAQAAAPKGVNIQSAWEWMLGEAGT